MTRLATILALSLLSIGLFFACTSAPTADTELGGLPPLLDRELFFGDPEISAAQLSPDGQFISFVKPYRDVRNIYVKGLDEPFDAARPITADKRPVLGYFWSVDSKHVLYVQDKNGDENFHIYSIDPAAEASADSGVPPAVDLTPVDGVRAAIYAVPKNKPGVLIAGLNDRLPAFHDVYEIDIASGERTLLIENNERIGNWAFDLEGNVRLAARQLPDGGTELLRVDEDGALVQVYVTTYEEAARPVRFHKDGKRVYLITNRGEENDLSRLVLFDPETGDEELIESDPEGEVDIAGAAFSEATDELVATVYVGDRVRIYPKTEEVANDLRVLEEKLPDGELGLQSATLDDSLFLVAVSRDVDPGSVYLYRRDTGDVELLYRGRPNLPSENLATMQPLRYAARDGLELRGYLTLPQGVEAKGLPLVVYPHGGPWARDNWGYDSFAQFLANRGYAVFQPNFRGSTGYGKAYLNAGNREWGTGAMQHDITDGVKHLIDQGIADPEKVCIFGGSYGGYATLAGVTFTPDLYSCGIPYVAPSNLITLIESFPAYWRPFLKGSWYLRVGDPENEADRQDLIARSPLTHVDQIRVPLLVVHGANDPRVKKTESDQIVAALTAKGHEVEYLVAPDEGHGFRSPENRMALAVAAERFLARQLGGRVQEDVPPKIQQRLDAITVDPATVSSPVAPDAMTDARETQEGAAATGAGAP